MNALLDTNIVVRYLTSDPPGQARKAATLLRTAERLVLVDLVCAEIVYVLESVYGQPRAQIASTMRSVLAFRAIAVVDHDLLLRALELYETARLDFAEAYLVAFAELSGIETIASFDRRLDRIDGIERVEEI